MIVDNNPLDWADCNDAVAVESCDCIDATVDAA